MKYHFFCVNDRPFCFYDNSYEDSNAEYIKSIQPQFYEFIAEQNIKVINSKRAKREKKQYAAISLRTYYSQALETLFALIFATLQAPKCIPAWMRQYKNCELEELLKKVNNSAPIKTRFTRIQNISWESIVNLIFLYYDEKDTSPKRTIIENFSRLLSCFADDYLDKSFSSEYNNIKHGLRTKIGGSTISIRETDRSGILKEDSNWQKFLGSEYGSSFYVDEKLLDSKNHFRVKLHSVNWDPENLYHGIYFICLFLENLLTFLKKFNNIKSDKLLYKSVAPSEVFDLPWKNVSGLGYYTMDFGFNYSRVKLFPKNKITSVYDLPKDEVG